VQQAMYGLQEKKMHENARKKNAQKSKMQQAMYGLQDKKKARKKMHKNQKCSKLCMRKRTALVFKGLKKKEFFPLYFFLVQ
jgi:hypothetical protein